MALKSVIDGSLQWWVETGDSLNVLRTMPDACIDAVVCDPPAGISFMGKSFDHNRGGRTQWVTWLAAILAEAYRVTKPGGRMLCWSIPRTMHWTGCAIEDAGWTIENTVAHMFGTGFPKAKSQLKPSREDWWLARKPGGKVLPLNIDECRVGLAGGTTKKDATAGAPSVNALADGLNGSYGVPIDGGRWPSNTVFSHSPGCERNGTKRVMATSIHGEATAIRRSGVHQEAGGHQTVGREQPVRGYADADGKESVENWTCVDGCPVKMLDAQGGGLSVTGKRSDRSRKAEVDGTAWYVANHESKEYTDKGTASRFFHCFEADPEALDVEPFHYFAKASTADRNEGCEHLPSQQKKILGAGFSTETKIRTADQETKGVSRSPSPNNHPTVKSTALMRYLVRLITKPDDIILDPFCGSGSTGKGALMEGRRFIGIEREAEYADIARARLTHAMASASATPKKAQLDLLDNK